MPQNKVLATPVKTGAYTRMDDLEQAVDQQAIWTNARDRLIAECHALGWSINVLARVTGMSWKSVAKRLRPDG